MAVVVIDQAAHAHAADWYGTRPSEPAGNDLSLSADVVVSLSGITLDAVLTEILGRTSHGGDVVIVCHARDMGLALPLLQGVATRARFDAVGALSADHATDSDGIPSPAMSPGEAAPMLRMSEAQVGSLRQKMARVRQLGLRHVALRGCNVGAWTNSLVTYKDFFGCRSLSGPTLRDTYGAVTPEIVSELAPWLGRHPGWHTFQESFPGGQVAIATHGGETDEHAYTINVAAQSPAALAEWGTVHLGRAPGGSLFYHGMWQTSASPGSPRIHFVRDAAYASHLTTV